MPHGNYGSQRNPTGMPPTRVTGNQPTNVGGNELPDPLHTCPSCGRTYTERGYVSGSWCPHCGPVGSSFYGDDDDG
jgi:hypothetical protein